jgi:hypothetical protein
MVTPPSRLEMQLLEQESSSCFAKSGGAICETPIDDETGRGSDQKQIRFLSVDEVPLMREGIATVINAKPDMQAISTKS